jgi:predicted PurR-regulated permease PerM
MSYNYKQRKTLVLIIIAVLGLFIIYSLRGLLTSILGAIVFYTLFKPWYVRLTEKKKMNRTLAAVIFILFSLVVLILPFFALSLLIIKRITHFAENPQIIQDVVNKIVSLAESKGINLPEMQNSAVEKVSGFALKLFPSVLNGAMSGFIGLAVLYFLMYFMLVDHEKFEKGLSKYLPFSSSDSHVLVEELKNITYSNVIGQAVIALIQGGLIVIGFLIFKIPDPLFWGMISFFLSFIPLLGTPLVFIPAGIYMLATQNTFSGVGILLWGFVLVMNIDNIIRLILAKRLGDVHPIITIIGLLVGIPYFGILGLVFGPLLISYFVLIVKIYERHFLASGNS